MDFPLNSLLSILCSWVEFHGQCHEKGDQAEAQETPPRTPSSPKEGGRRAESRLLPGLVRFWEEIYNSRVILSIVNHPISEHPILTTHVRR
jgi:hypothetical protein